MDLRTIFMLSAGVLATPVAAQDAAGDADAGEALFDRQCTACHVVRNEQGEVLAGRNAKTGPNLHGVVGAAPGSQQGFAYSKSLVAYGESGATWGEDNTAEFLQDPTGHLREALDNPGARSKMAYKVRSEEDALDIYAFLATFSAESAPADEETAAGEGKDAAAGEAKDATSGEAATDAPAGGAVVDIAAGEKIYQDTCRSCHGPKAQGMASFPKLAGHDAEYLELRLEQYKAGETVGFNSGLMIPVASALSDDDIANVSAYISETFE